MRFAHYTLYPTLDEAVVAFGAFCRNNKLRIGLNHAEEALQVSKSGFINDFDNFKFALKALFCTCEEDYQIFDHCFQVFWSKRKHDYAHKTDQKKNTSNVTKNTKSSLVMMGFDPSKKREEEDEEDAHNITGASKIESLKCTDFSKVAAIDSHLLDQIAEQLLRQLNHKLKRKLQTSKRGKIDLRKTIRRNLSNGDLLLNLSRKSRKQEKYRIILLLDVSGSMDKYSFFLLKFMLSLKAHLRNIEAFIFSTKLVRVTDYMNHEQLEETLLQLSAHADNWSSGTKIGECLGEFNDTYAKRILNGKSITIVLSDGLDNGKPELLNQELKKIKMRTSKLVWLNPLKGTKGYEPTAQGMQAALPELDQFETAHNLQSLMELENILSHV